MNSTSINSSLPDSFSFVKNQLVLENELQVFFKKTPPTKIADEFENIQGAVSNQFGYLTLALKVIEELDVEPVQAFGLLEAIRPIIIGKHQIIISRFVGKTYESRSKAGELIEEAMELLMRLTATYDSVIEEAKYFGDSQIFIMGSAIHRALSDKSYLISCYQKLYLSIPENIWRHVNSLYIIADDFNVFNQCISDHLIFPDHSLTVKHVYLYIMLLSTYGSRNLNVEDNTVLIELMKGLAPELAILKNISEEVAENGCLCMDPESMEYPQFSNTLGGQMGKRGFYLDFTKIEKRLRSAHMIRTFIDGKMCNLSVGTAQKILSNWLEYKERNHERSEAKLGEKAIVTVGLLMGWLQNMSAPSSMPECSYTKNDFKERKLSYSSGNADIDFNSIRSINKKKGEAFYTKIIDYSDHGYCLEWEINAISKLSIGELVIINDVFDRRCRLGQIVWLKRKTKDTVTSGISLLSDEVCPVVARLMPFVAGPVNEQDRKTYKALVFKHDINKRISYGLVLESESIKAGQVIEIFQNDKVYHAQLMEEMSKRSKYQIFNLAFYEGK